MGGVLNGSDGISLALDKVRVAGGCGTSAADEAGGSDESGVSLGKEGDHVEVKSVDL